MVVIGIDFGSDSCVVSAWINNRAATILNDYYERKTPSYVAFSDKKRIIGTSGLNQQASNVTSTIFGFKNELGYSSDVKAANTNVFNLLDITEAADGLINYKIKYQNKINSLRPEIVASMLLSKLNADASEFLKSSLTGCVIAVPSYFTRCQQKNLLLAAGIAGLNCFYLIKETTSVAVNYAFYEKFPSPRNVIFVDIGRSSIQVSACAFSTQKIWMLAEVSAPIGGWDLDILLAKHFIKLLEISAEEDKSFCVGLLMEVENLKKKVGLVTNNLPLSIEHLHGMKDPLTLQRSEMEEICQPLFAKVEDVLRDILVSSKLDREDIHSIEIVGGSTRIPKVKQLIEKVFGQQPKMRMNQDEAVSKGCLLSWLIKTKRVKFEIIETSTTPQNYEPNHDYLAIREIHSNYMASDHNDFLVVTKAEFEKYGEDELKLIKNDEMEKERCEVRNQLDELLNGLKDNVNFCQFVGRKYFDEVKYWHHGTTEKYREKISEIKQWVEESVRKPQINSDLDKQDSTALPLEQAISETSLEETSTEIENRDQNIQSPMAKAMSEIEIPKAEFETASNSLPAYKRKPLVQGPFNKVELATKNSNMKLILVDAAQTLQGVLTEIRAPIYAGIGYKDPSIIKSKLPYNPYYAAPVKNFPDYSRKILDDKLLERWTMKNIEMNILVGPLSGSYQRIGKAINTIQNNDIDSLIRDIFKLNIEAQITEALEMLESNFSGKSPKSHKTISNDTFEAYAKLLKLVQETVHYFNSICADKINKVSVRTTAV